MINSPFADLATPSSGPAATAAQLLESDTPASVEFQSVFEDTSESEIARLPEADAGDTAGSGIREMLFGHADGRQTDTTGSTSMLYEMVIAGSPEGQAIPDQPGHDPLGYMQGLLDRIQGLPDGVPDDLPAQTENDADPIVEQPSEAEAQTDIPSRFELPDTSQSEDNPINLFYKAGLGENLMVGDDGVKPNESKEPLPPTVKNDGGQAAAHLSAEQSAQFKAPIGSAPLDGAGDSLKPSILQQQIPRPEESGYFLSPRKDGTSFIKQPQFAQSLDTGRGPSARMLPASDATLVPYAASERVIEEQKGAIAPKQSKMPPRETGTPQELPKPLPSTGMRDQVSRVQMQTGQPKGTQPDSVLTSAAVLPENAAKTHFVAASAWTEARAVPALVNVPIAKSTEGEKPRRLLQESPQIPHAGTPKAGQQVIQATPVNAPVTLVEPDETGLFEIRNSVDSTGIVTTSAHTANPIPSQHNPLLAAPEIPRHVARQLVEAARQLPERPVELTLNPTELGRVRLTFTLTDGGINVAVLAERGETMDLMRRHIETLAQEFRDLGYADVGIQFSQNGQGGADQDSANAQTRPNAIQATMSELETTIPAKVSLEPSSGLDLRL